VANVDELQAIKEFEASFEKKPNLINPDESYKKTSRLIECAEKKSKQCISH